MGVATAMKVENTSWGCRSMAFFLLTESVRILDTKEFSSQSLYKGQRSVKKKYLLSYLNQHLCPNGQPMRLFFPQVWHWTHAHAHMHTRTRNTPQTCFIYQTMWMHILTQSLSVCQLNIFSVIFSLFKPSHALQSCLPEQLNLVVMCAFSQQAQCTL